MPVTITEKNFFHVCPTSVADSYAPSVPTTVVNLQVCNKSASSVNLTVYVYDSDAAISYEIISALPVAAGQTVTLITRNIILEAGDKIRSFATTANALVLSGFAAEKTVS